jgi:hypothetical protein
MMRKIAIGLATAAIAVSGSTLTASAFHYKSGDHSRPHHGVIDYMSKHHGPRGQALGQHRRPHVFWGTKHHGPRIDYWSRHHGPYGMGPWHRGPEHFGRQGRHKGPIPHYRGGRITDTWP